MRGDTADYRQLFLSGIPLMDTRAPVEFLHGSFPNATNLPLMNDEERAAVGTCYRQHGQQAAIALGHEMVSGAVKEARIQAWKDFANKHPEGYLFCFRGGMRSKISQQWLAEEGLHYPRVTGGYKAMRRYLLGVTENTAETKPLVVLAGQTGTGKTDLLLEIPFHVDLEGLARHRGSAFGKRVGGQPSQIDFENALSVSLLRQHHDFPDRILLLEDESRLIGRMFIPLSLQQAMSEAPLVMLKVSLEERVELTFRHYILGNLEEWQLTAGEEDGFRLFSEELRQSLYNIRRRLGGERYAELVRIMDRALSEHAGGDASGHLFWITIMLRDYYDPMYAYQMSRKVERVIFEGNCAEVRDFLLNYLPES